METPAIENGKTGRYLHPDERAVGRAVDIRSRNKLLVDLNVDGSGDLAQTGERVAKLGAVGSQGVFEIVVGQQR